MNVGFGSFVKLLIQVLFKSKKLQTFFIKINSNAIVILNKQNKLINKFVAYFYNRKLKNNYLAQNFAYQGLGQWASVSFPMPFPPSDQEILQVVKILMGCNVQGAGRKSAPTGRPLEELWRKTFFPNPVNPEVERLKVMCSFINNRVPLQYVVGLTARV